MQVTLSKLPSETIAIPMICTLIRYGFPTVFSIVGKILLYSNTYYNFLLSFFYFKHQFDPEDPYLSVLPAVDKVGLFCFSVKAIPGVI